MQTINLYLNIPATGDFPGSWAGPINANFAIIDALFSNAQGHTHDGGPGSGGRISHSSLSAAGAYSHAELDAHLDNIAIHTDTKIGQIDRRVGGLVTQSFLDVATLQFENCDVEQSIPGVVLIRPAAGAAAPSVQQIAPVVAHIDFTGAAGSSLIEQDWILVKNQPNAAGFVMKAPAGARLSTGNGAGFCSAFLRSTVPHSLVQRVTVKVGPEYGPSIAQVTDQWSLWLHLLASPRAQSLTTAQPVELGVSLALEVRAVNGSLRLMPKLVARSLVATAVFTAFPSPAGWSNPNGGVGWTNLPRTYLIGSHELSISATDASADFTISYYYEGGLIFTRLFTATDGLFFTVVRDLIDQLANTTPAVADCGHFGFSTTYSLSGLSSDALFDIGVFSAASVGERTTPRIVSIPTGAGGGTVTGVCPTTNTADWAGVALQQSFDVDGAGPVSANQWRVISNVVPTALLSESFVIQNTATSAEHNVHCGTPIPSPITSTQCLRALGTSAVTLLGRDLPIPEFSILRLRAASGNIPHNWFDGGYGEEFYSVGEELPISFGRFSGTQLRELNQAAGHSLQLGILGGTRLPWGARVTAEIVPQYQADTDYVAVFTQALEVCAAAPVVEQTLTYKFTPANEWEPVEPGQPVEEGASVVFVLSGRNIPLGPAFWTSGKGFEQLPGYTLADTAGSVGSALTLTGPVDVYYSGIMRGRLSVNEGVTGLPPTAPVTAVGLSYNAIADPVRELVFVAGRVRHNGWQPGGTSPVVMELRDTEAPALFNTVTFIPAAGIAPKAPEIVSGVLTPNLNAGSSVTLEIQVWYPDADIGTTIGAQLTLTSGFSTTATLTRSSGGVSVSSSAGGEFETWTVTGLQLSAVPATSIQVTFTNVLPTTPQSSVLVLGTVGSAPGSTPSVTYTAGTCIEDTVQNITLTGVISTLEPGTVITVAAPSTEFLTIVGTPTFVDAGPDRIFTVRIGTRDLVGGGTLPALVSLVVRNPQANTTLTISNIPAQQATAPDIVRADLDAVDSGVTGWSIGELGSRWLYVRINDTTPSRLSNILPTGVATSTSVIFGQFEHVTGNVYRTLVTLAEAALGDTISIKATNATAGDPLEDTLVDAVEIVATINTQSASFVTNPSEGHYFEFALLGQFDTGGEDLLVDFVDELGVSLLSGSVTITSLSPSLVTGNARVANNKDGKGITVRLEIDNTAITSQFNTNTVVSVYPLPAITGFIINPNVEGTVGATITIDGSYLIPPAPPVGRPPLSYAYVFNHTGVVPIITGASLLPGSTSTKLVFSANIAEGTGGQSVGIDIVALGGDAFRMSPTVPILAASSGNPAITSVTLTSAEEDSMEFGQTTTLVITGTGLGAGNVAAGDGLAGIRLSVDGFENAGAGNLRESPPGQGVDGGLFRALISSLDILTQSDTSITARLTPPITLVDTKLRVHLLRAPGHVLGAGEWPQSVIDAITPTDARHRGLLVDGPSAVSLLKVNALPAQGPTRLDMARTFQQWLATSPTGSSSLVVTFDRVPTTMPVIVPVADAVYPELVLKDISVAAVPGNAFAYTVYFSLPSADEVSEEGYPGGVLNSVFPITFGLRLASGVPIVSGVYGINTWRSPAQEQSLHIPLN